jgi:hypothetical protein
MFNSPFDDPRLDKFKDQNEENEEYGVYLKFNCTESKNIKVCYAYWSNNHYATFEDVGGNNNPSLSNGRKSIKDPNSKELFLLIQQLLKFHQYINIVVDRKNMAMFPSEFKILEKILTEYYGNNENVYLEFPSDSSPSEIPTAKRDIKVSAPVLLSKTDIFELQKQIMSGVRTNQNINSKFMESDPTLRNRAIEIGVKALQRGYTLDDALDEVEAVLDRSIKEEYIDEFSKSSKSLDRDDDDSTVIDRPQDDIKDLTSSRNELLRIMKLAGQSSTGDKPAGWNLVLYDDPITPGDAVVEGLQSVMGMSNADVQRVIMECTRNKKSVLKTYAIEDKALSVRDKLKSAIDNNSSYYGGNGTYGPWNVRVEVLKA